jgi:hypothetical protein
MSDRQWLYGLTADEWLHLAAEGDQSEVQPCCGNLGELRELLNELVTSQSPDDTGWRRSIGKRLLSVYEADREGHGLPDRAQFPLLHKVLDGLREEIASDILGGETNGDK